MKQRKWNEKQIFYRRYIKLFDLDFNSSIDSWIEELTSLKIKLENEGWTNVYLHQDDDDNDICIMGDREETDDEFKARIDKKLKEDQKYKKSIENAKQQSIDAAAAMLRKNGYSVIKKDQK